MTVAPGAPADRGSGGPGPAGAVCAVVVNYRTADLTAEAVRSALAPPGCSTAVVVDNGSGDGSTEQLAAALADRPVRIVASATNLGFGQGVNLGVGHTAAPYVLLLNSDARVVPGAVPRLVAALDGDDRLAAAAPRVLLPDGSDQPDAIGPFPSLATMVGRHRWRSAEPGHPDWVSGAAVLVRSRAFEEAGGFDPAFRMYLEDVDLCRRWRAAGWRVAVVPEAVVVHSRGASGESDRRQDAQYHASLLTYLRRAGWSGATVRAVDVVHRLWVAAVPRRRRQRAAPPSHP